MCSGGNGQPIYMGDPDSGRLTVMGGQPGYLSHVEKKDGEWLDVKSIEYEQWGDKQKVQTGNAPPPDRVNNEVVNNPSLGIDKSSQRSPKKTKEDLKVRLKGRSSQKNMTGNITQDTDLKAGGINL